MPRQRNKLVVIIPALNEEQTVTAVIKKIPRKIAGITSIETVVIDDGSTDKTAARALRAGAHIVHHPRTMGVGAAFHTGMRQALERGADIIVNIDADGQFNPGDIPKLIKPILRHEAWFVTCTRFADPRYSPDMPIIKRWGNRGMVILVNMITQQKFTDVSCGFRAYNRETALRMILFGHFTYTQESFIDLAFKNIPITEVPLLVRGEREFGKSRVASNLWRFGTKAFSIIFRAARDYLPLHFFGLPGLIAFLLGVGGYGFLLYHFMQTGQTSPYRSLVTLSGVLVIVGFLLFFLAMIADMLHRSRLLIEKIVYLNRKDAYSKAKSRDTTFADF